MLKYAATFGKTTIKKIVNDGVRCQVYGLLQYDNRSMHIGNNGGIVLELNRAKSYSTSSSSIW